MWRLRKAEEVELVLGLVACIKSTSFDIFVFNWNVWVVKYIIL
jgi:hypothetical protein